MTLPARLTKLQSQVVTKENALAYRAAGHTVRFRILINLVEVRGFIATIRQAGVPVPLLSL